MTLSVIISFLFLQENNHQLKIYKGNACFASKYINHFPEKCLAMRNFGWWSLDVTGHPGEQLS